MATGRIVRAVGGFFFVEPQAEEQELIKCTARGKVKKKNEDTILVGDMVEYEIIDGCGVIHLVLERQNVLKRPYIANVNQILLVFAYDNPAPNNFLIAKFMLLAECSRIPYALVFNKKDLVPAGTANLLAEKYRSNGYTVFSLSTLKNEGKPDLLSFLKNKTAVLAGPSGVGKSAILNMIVSGASARTGEVSQKIGRGRHTTREVQLLHYGKHEYIADTPGFTQISLDFLQPREVSYYFPEFYDHARECRFASCLHDMEIQCGVKRAVEEGLIDTQRYQHYLEFLKEVKQFHSNRYR